MNKNTGNGIFVNSIIGEGTRFKGELEITGLLRIDGDFEGNVRTDGRVLIGRTGRARCIIEADTIVVGGVVKGDLKAVSRVIMLSTCLVIGNVCSPEILAEEGVVLHGHCAVPDSGKDDETGDSGSFSVDWEKSPSE